MTEKGLNFDLADQSLDQFLSYFCQRDLFDRKKHLGCVVLCSEDITESAFSQYFCHFELLEEGKGFLFAEDLWSFGFLDFDIPVDGGQNFKGIICGLDIFSDLEGSDLYLFLIFLISFSLGLGLQWFSISKRDS